MKWRWTNFQMQVALILIMLPEIKKLLILPDYVAFYF